MVMNRRELFIYVVLWGSLVVGWNFGYSSATPLQDVLAAIAMLIISKFAIKRFA